MRRALLVLAACTLIVSGCNVTGSSSSPTPARTADIKRAKLDIAYSAFVDQDLHHVTSKKALEGALAAVKTLVKETGGKDDVAAPEFKDIDEPVLDDFKKFADAVGQLAARNPQVSADRLADTAIGGMIDTSPDCHTYYVNGPLVHKSRPFTPRGSAAKIPAQGTTLGGPDEAGLTGRLLPGGVAYITFRAFVLTGTYKVNEALRAMLDRAVAQGARAWLFDLRGNLGGIAMDLHSMFLNGEPTLTIHFKNGPGGTASGNRDLRLPSAYQLPMAVIVNDLTGSGPEIFAASLKENKRATIVGQTTIGCVGEITTTRFSDGGLMAVVGAEFTGAVTGTKYNNVGVSPDIAADDPAAVDKAIEVLNQKIGP